MLTRKLLDEHIAKNGPYLYHRAPADALPLIFAQGLLPWDHEHRTDVDEFGEGSTTSYDSSRMLPRSDRVYLGGPGYVRSYDGITIRVDLRELDPLTIDCDEDHVDFVRRHDVPDWIRSALPEPPREWGSWEEFREPDCGECAGAGCLECDMTGRDLYADPRDEISLGDWADEHTKQIDAPETVAYSLACGSVAVSGGVPAASLSLDLAKLTARDLEAISRAFGATVDVAPFSVHEDGVELTVEVEPDGRIVAPAELPESAWKLHALAEQHRGATIVEQLNQGRARELAPEMPSLLPIERPTAASVLPTPASSLELTA